MMNLRIILDLNLSPIWVDYLSAHSINAHHWREIGNLQDSDEIILQEALKLNAVVFTQDLDCGTILTRNQLSLPSVIQLRSPLNLPDQIGTLVIEILQANESRIQSGVLITIEPPLFRIRDLPIV